MEGTAADGSRVFAATFDATEVADHPRAGRLFALAVPVDDADASRLEQIRLTGPGIGMATVTRPPAALRTAPANPVAAGRPRPAASRSSGTRRRIPW